MQLLMGATLPADAATEHREAYARLSNSLLEVMGIMLTELLEPDHAIRAALDVLIEMASVLEACGALDPLLGLLGTLRALVVLLPPFSRLVFVRPEGEEQERKAGAILEVLCKIVCRQLVPAEGAWETVKEELAKETLGLLGDLAWVVPDEYEAQCVSRVFGLSREDVTDRIYLQSGVRTKPSGCLVCSTCTSPSDVVPPPVGSDSGATGVT